MMACVMARSAPADSSLGGDRDSPDGDACAGRFPIPCDGLPVGPDQCAVEELYVDSFQELKVVFQVPQRTCGVLSALGRQGGCSSKEHFGGLSSWRL